MMTNHAIPIQAIALKIIQCDFFYLLKFHRKKKSKNTLMSPSTPWSHSFEKIKSFAFGWIKYLIPSKNMFLKEVWFDHKVEIWKGSSSGFF